ncbi:MAG: flagellar M-ring protein FliF [Spirochaetales bacterium]|nr:flagellar M-ring protein FliF [Spirochaetales bacterium]
MNEWLKKFIEQLKQIWGKWTPVQKGIFFGSIGVVILAVVLLVAFSAQPSMVPLIGSPVSDDELRGRITARLDQEIPGKYKVAPDNRILVTDQPTARRMRTILVREDLIPKEADPWEIFDVERWTITDFERKINVRRAVEKSLEQHLMALEDIDAVKVEIDLPEESLFVEDEKPYTASVIITPKPGSDLIQNRAKIEGIEKLIMLAVSGLDHETIVITDNYGTRLNDYEGLADLDKLNLTKRQLRLKREKELEYKHEILKALQIIYRPDRVTIPKMEIDLDFSEEKSTSHEITPVVMVEDNPNTPFSEREVQESVLISEEHIEEEFKGTGYNPEGPPGSEGQTPPQYQDLSNLVGEYNHTTQRSNYDVNRTDKERVERPWDFGKITVGIAIDGYWEKVYDKNGNPVFEEDNNTKLKRIYHSVTPDELKTVESLIQGAIGYDRARGDDVTVEHFQFDRRAQFEKEDQKALQGRYIAQTIFWICVGLGAIILSGVFFRMLSKYFERKRREKEEELARQHQAMREAALKSAEEQGMDVELTVEERARMEMQENAINMAREHPEDVAQLIRTWLMEE